MSGRDPLRRAIDDAYGLGYSVGYEDGREASVPFVGLVLWFMSGVAIGATVAGVVLIWS